MTWTIPRTEDVGATQSMTVELTNSAGDSSSPNLSVVHPISAYWWFITLHSVATSCRACQVWGRARITIRTGPTLGAFFLRQACTGPGPHIERQCCAVSGLPIFKRLEVNGRENDTAINFRTTTWQKCEAVSRRDRISGSKTCVSLNSRHESNGEEREDGRRTGSGGRWSCRSWRP